MKNIHSFAIFVHNIDLGRNAMKTTTLIYKEIAGNAPYHCAHTQAELLGTSGPLHTHDFEEIFLVTRGEIIHEIEGRREVLTAGCLRLIHAQDNHRLCYFRGKSGEFINVAFRQGQIEPILQALGHTYCSAQTVLDTESIERVGQCFLWMHANYIRQPRREHLSVLLTTCLEQLTQPIRAYPDYDYIDIALSELEVLRFARRGLGGLLERTSISLPHLCRTVKSRTGKTPTQLINEARLRHARLMLSDSSQSIENIAYEVGFENTPYFYRLFRARFGESPGQFRAKQRAILGGS
jgi:AraC family transcriptional regulator, dual regulator of chb operon